MDEYVSNTENNYFQSLIKKLKIILLINYDVAVISFGYRWVT